MNIFLISKIAYQTLNKHKTRTALTTLGVVIGIASVVMVFATGSSVRSFITDQVNMFGNDIVQVEVKVPNVNKSSSQNAMSMAQGVTITTLKIEDAQALAKLPIVKNLTYGLTGQEVLQWQNKVKSALIFGVNDDFADVYKIEMGEGSFYTDQQGEGMSRVVVLGSKLKEKLFGTQSAVGETVRIRQQNYRVVGVTKEKGYSFMDLDSMAYIPVKTLQKQILGVDYINFITTKVASVEQIDQAVADITAILKVRHDFLEDNPDRFDFAVNTTQEAMTMISSVLQGLTILLLVIAGISLLVGGIGIMNIMYVSVMERTYEIGLRKAVGATPLQIKKQFLIEAALITFGGAIIGIGLGSLLALLISIVATMLGYSWPFSVPLYGIITAVTVSVSIGLLFGWYPAQKAAKLDPITALHKA